MYLSISLSTCIYVCIYIYIYLYMYMYICIYILRFCSASRSVRSQGSAGGLDLGEHNMYVYIHITL